MLEKKNENFNYTYVWPQGLAARSSRSQKVQSWIHSWLVKQLWSPSCKRHRMQKRLHELHCDRQSWTLARRSMTALSNVRRSSSMLEFPAWNRCTFDFSQLSTWAARRSTRWARYCARSKVHSESSPCCLEVIWSQDSRRVPRKASRSATGASGPASKNVASESSASITRSVSKFCGSQFGAWQMRFEAYLQRFSLGEDL